MLYYEKTAKEGSYMANYGKYYIAVRLLLLKQYLEANAGRIRTPTPLLEAKPKWSQNQFLGHNNTASFQQIVRKRMRSDIINVLCWLLARFDFIFVQGTKTEVRLGPAVAGDAHPRRI